MYVVWTGPASPYQASGWTPPPGASAVNLQCTGDGSPTCGQIADSWAETEGYHLPALRASKGLDPGEPIAFNAFSAGGSLVKRVVMSAADRAEVPVVVLADALYTSDRHPDGSAVAPEGIVRYAEDAARGKGILVATSSSAPNKTYPSGSEVLRAVKKELERRSGFPMLETGWTEQLGIAKQPVGAWQLGNAFLADYGSVVSHAGHVTELNAAVWREIVGPLLQGRSPGPGPAAPDAPAHEVGEKSPTWAWLAGGAGLIVGFAGARWALARWRGRG